MFKIHTYLDKLFVAEKSLPHSSIQHIYMLERQQNGMPKDNHEACDMLYRINMVNQEKKIKRKQVFFFLHHFHKDRLFSLSNLQSLNLDDVCHHFNTTIHQCVKKTLLSFSDFFFLHHLSYLVNVYCLHNLHLSFWQLFSMNRKNQQVVISKLWKHQLTR